MNSIHPLDKGIFVLSLDLELAWGSIHDGSYATYEQFYEKTRPVITSLLELFEQYNIRATWATVGHLFLSECNHSEGTKHPEIVRPSYSWFEGDWFKDVPDSNIHDAPLWFGRDILLQIQNCSVPQEIGSHTFSHVIVSDPEYSECSFASELAACQNAAKSTGIPPLKSFVYPSNGLRYPDLLPKYGFTCYRGNVAKWHGINTSKWWKYARIIDEFCMFTPPTVLPKYENGLLNIPSSYFYPQSIGWGRWMPISFRVRKIVSGVRKAAKQKKIFHLWFHPFNIATNPTGLLKGLEQAFVVVKKYQDRGDIDCLSMGEIAALLSASEG